MICDRLHIQCSRSENVNFKCNLLKNLNAIQSNVDDTHLSLNKRSYLNCAGIRKKLGKNYSSCGT